MRLRKTLPADIEQIIDSGDVEALARAVQRCEIGAYLRSSAFELRLMHFPASKQITDFLLERGEDINSRDHYGRTPIHSRVWYSRLEQIPYLIERGGDINARSSSDDQTPLFGVVEYKRASDVEKMIAWGANPRVVADSRVYGKATLTGYTLRRRSFVDSVRALEVMQLLLSHGAPVDERISVALEEMDRQRCTFISHGHEHISPAEFAAISDAFAQLCELFGVQMQQARRAPKPGEQLTLDANEDVFEQFDQLWQLLVPTSGQCETVQGEVIRIAGKVGYEIYNNGGVNWRRSFTALLRQYLTIVASGQALAPADLARAKEAVASLKARSMDNDDAKVITQLAVRWVQLNPLVKALDLPDVGL